MNIKFLNKKSISTLALLMVSPMAFAEGRGFLQLVQEFGSLFKATGSTAYDFAMMAGIICAIAGLLMWAFSSKTNNPQNSKSAAAIFFIVGVCLAGITGLINMGNNTVVGSSDSEFSQYYEAGSSSTPNNK
ncbi:DUF6750 family protein [Vibrio anguillarum]|uniref:Uncharacterized protein n=1 Tax=Vibrio anguillarum TaxID=55601 RepID=A0AAW4BG72_VIBAN|nr:DUF6750 family protein [Vibrio anguillarum]MBF4374373.1 hypothetical protein [Vibrio anguillarum]MBF4436796.1 hypothetical protein [Vibrio anguillarum]